jgi:hypothetical protein
MHHRRCAANGNDGNVTSRRCHRCAGLVREAATKSSVIGTRTKCGCRGTLTQRGRVTPNAINAGATLTSGCIVNTLLVAKALIRIFGSRFFLEH